MCLCHLKNVSLVSNWSLYSQIYSHRFIFLPAALLFYRASLAVFDVSIVIHGLWAVIYLQRKDRQCIKIKADQTETTYPDLHMIFTRSILSSAQTSARRLTQPPNIPTLSIPSQNTHTNTHTQILSVALPGSGCIDCLVLTHRELLHLHNSLLI